MDPTSAVIADVPDANRYEAHIGDALAGFVEYRWVGGHQALLHTEVLATFEGRGVGSALARYILEKALAAATPVTVLCPFLRTYVERHPAYAGVAVMRPERGVGRSG